MLKTLRLNFLECTVVSIYVLIVYLVPKLSELQHSLQSVASQSTQLAFIHQNSWSIALWSIATIALIAWAYSYRNARLISNIPTSNISSASQGYVEIQGTIKSAPEALLTSPSGTKCAWYSVKHYEADGDNRSYLAELLDIDWLFGLFKSREGYALIGEHTSKNPIQIEDNTGACWVLPEDARVFTKHTKISHPNSLYRFEEQLLYPDTKIYVIGDFSSESKPLPKMDAQQETMALIETWQQDEASFKQKFDANKDGHIDLKEWESARKQAQHQVKTNHDNIKKESQQHYISQPLYGEHFIISETAPNTIHQHFLGWATLHFIVMVIALYLVNTSSSYQEFKQILSVSNLPTTQAKQTNQTIENTPTDLSALEPTKSVLDE